MTKYRKWKISFCIGYHFHITKSFQDKSWDIIKKWNYILLIVNYCWCLDRKPIVDLFILIISHINILILTLIPMNNLNELINGYTCSSFPSFQLHNLSHFSTNHNLISFQVFDVSPSEYLFNFTRFWLVIYITIINIDWWRHRTGNRSLSDLNKLYCREN